MSNFLRVSLALLVVAAVIVAVRPHKPKHYDLLPLWETALADDSATLYTSDVRERDDSVRDGYVQHGVVAWIACASSSLKDPNGESTQPSHADFGYSLPMGFVCAAPKHSAPLYRFSNHASPADRVYATSTAETETLVKAGYAFERIDGYILTTQAAGSVALHRLSRCLAHDTQCHAQHRYSISTDTRDRLLATGWHSEGIVGYVFDGYNNRDVYATFTGTMNGVAGMGNAPVRVAIQDVAAPKGTIALGGRGRTHVLGEFASNSTTRPAGADRQRIAFSLYTGDLFDAGKTNIDHIAIWLHGHAQFASDGAGGVPYDGLGIFLSLPQWAGNHCSSGYATGGQIFVEEMSKAHVDCAANLPKPLEAEHWYDISLTVTARAELSYTVKNRATAEVFSFSKDYAGDYACPIAPAPGSLPLSQLYCNNPFSYDRFPDARTGYFIWPIFADATPAAGRMEGITVQWLDPAGRVLSTQ